MKTVVLLRHAKTKNAIHGQSDFDRELHDIGHHQLKQLANYFQISHSNDSFAVVYSAACRTAQTFLGIKENLTTTSVDKNENLYLAASHELLRVINSTDFQTDFILIIGHNEGISELASHFKNDFVHLSTGSLITFEFECDSWKEVSQANARFTGYFSPQGLN